VNRAALVLGLVLVLAVSLFVGGFGYAFYLAKSSGRLDEVLFRQECGAVNVSSPVYNFSPPVPMYQALRTVLQSSRWTASSLSNMTISVSLDYTEFTNLTIIQGNNTGRSYEVHRIHEVTQPATSYLPVVEEIENNGTITYRYVWSISIRQSGFPIFTPALYWVDVSNGEIVKTGLIV
jgi:hypothetical protein